MRDTFWTRHNCKKAIRWLIWTSVGNKSNYYFNISNETMIKLFEDDSWWHYLIYHAREENNRHQRAAKEKTRRYTTLKQLEGFNESEVKKKRNRFVRSSLFLYSVISRYKLFVQRSQIYATVWYFHTKNERQLSSF